MGPGREYAEAVSERTPARGIRDPFLEWTLLSKRQHASQELSQELEPEPQHHHLLAETSGESVSLPSFSFLVCETVPT